MTHSHSGVHAQLDALLSADPQAMFAELVRAGLQAGTSAPRTAPRTATVTGARLSLHLQETLRHRYRSYVPGRSSPLCLSVAGASTGPCTR